MEKQPAILTTDAEIADAKQQVPSGSKFDQMKEQLRMTELNRAQANLKAMKVFRVTNEKMYADKELQELRRKEIREPLDEALTTIEILQGKLQRREDLIQKLRHYISVDLLKVSQNTAEENRSKVVELNQVEEHNQIVLMDTISELQRTMESQQGRVARCKTIITNQQERIKELLNEIDVQEFNHKEQIRHIESDKDIYLGMVESREHKIEVLMEEKDELEEQVGDLEDSLKATKSKLKDAEGQVKHFVEALKIAQAEREELQAKYSATEFSYLQCKEALAESQERATNLRERYEALVTELDGMVEAGCIIPTAEELQAAKAKTKRESKKSMVKQKSITSSNKSKLKDKSLMSGGSLTIGSDSLDGDGSLELAEGSTEGDLGKPDYRNPDGVKFQTRAKREDRDLEGQILENRAVRHGDALATEVAHLRRVMETMKSDHEEALHREQQASKVVEQAHLKLSAEVTRINAKRKEMAAENTKLKEDLAATTEKMEELMSQSAELQQQLQDNIQRPEMATVETLTTASLLESNETGEVVFDDELTTPRGRRAHIEDDGMMWDNHEATEYDMSFDPNAYISAPPVDAATQAGASASEYTDHGTQFPYLYDPDWQPNNVSSQTNVADFMYPTEIYLETLFRDFISESRTYIPEQNLSILQLSRFNETDKEKASRLGMRDVERPPLVEEDAQFRVKRALSYLSALNDLRNKHIKYVNKTGSWNTANTRMVIRCIDLVLQTTHNVLCPIVMQEDSDYAELRRATDPGEEAYYSDEGDPSVVFGEMQEITNQWKRATKAVIKRHSTFKLTESELVGDHNYGAPKGILNTGEGQTLSKAVVKYMNRAVRPRKTVGNADQLLDAAEGKAAPPINDRSPSHRSSAPPSRSGADNSRDSSISPPRSASTSMKGGGASPIVAAFAANVLAVAAFGYGSSDSSPEASPTMARFRKRMSETMPLPEVPESVEVTAMMSETAPAQAPTTAVEAHVTRAIDGYYNFGTDVRAENAQAMLEQNKVAATVELPPDVVNMDSVSNVKVRINREKPVGISFHIHDDSDDEQSTNLPEAPRSRKASRSPNKKGSVGYIAAAALATGDFIDYTRIPFDSRSPENTGNIGGKKMSVSGTPTGAVHRKASTKDRKQSSNRHFFGAPIAGEEDRMKAFAMQAEPTDPNAIVMSDDITTRAQTAATETTAEAEDTRIMNNGDITEGLSLQLYINQMDRVDENCLTSLSTLPALVDLAAEATSSRKPSTDFGVIMTSRPTSQGGSKGPSSRVGTASEKRADLRTPTLSERADRLQLGTPLPSPKPAAFAVLEPGQGLDSIQGTPRGTGGAGGVGGGLKALLKRNIEVSAMAVYQLQDQQQARRDQQGSVGALELAAGLATAKAAPLARTGDAAAAVAQGQASGTGVHPPSRLKPSSHAKSMRNSRSKPKEIDWSNGTIPVVGPTGIPTNYAGNSAAPSATSSTLLLGSSVGGGVSASSDARSSFQLPLEGSVDVQKMLSVSQIQTSRWPRDGQDEVVVRHASPVATGDPTQQQQMDFTVAGQKRGGNPSKKEKVTNTVLFM